MVRGRSTRSYAIEAEASSHQGATSSYSQTVLPTQTAPSSHPAPPAQPQNEVVSELLPALIAIHETIKRLAGNQTAQTPISKSAPPVIEPVIDEPVQGVTPTNVDSLSTAR